METRLQGLREKIDRSRRRSGELQHALETMTTVDPVTGVRNRLGILQSIEGALQWNAREGTPFGVMAVWVPALSEVTRHEARTVGEEAMAHVAAVVSAGLRAVDRVGLWDDALFLVVLAKLTDEKGASRVSSRLASMLSPVPFMAGDTEYPLVPRIACALVGGGASVRAEEVVRRLEQATGSDDPSRPDIIRVQ